VERSVGFATLFNDEALEVMPKVLSNSTSAVLVVIRLIKASGDGRSVIDGMLYVYFIGNMCGSG
jgi:hypothetical protein